MKKCVLRIGSELASLQDPQISDACINYVSEMGPLYYQYYIGTAKAHLNRLPFPEKPTPRKSLITTIRLLSPKQKTLFYEKISTIHSDWTEEVRQIEAAMSPEKQGDDAYAGYHLDSAHYDALFENIELLQSCKMEFASVAHFRSFLQNIYPRYCVGIKPSIDFLSANFLINRNNRNLRCYLEAVLQFTKHRYQPHILDTPDRAEELKKLEHYMAECIPNPKEWYLGFLPQIDGWSLHLADHLDDLASEQHSYWTQFIELMNQAKGKKPNKQFIQDSEQMLHSTPPHITTSILELCESSLYTKSVAPVMNGKVGKRNLRLIHEDNFNRVRGLIWMCRILNSSRSPLILERILDKCFRKLDGCGPMNEMLGQAAIDSLLHIQSPLNKTRFEKLLEIHKKNKNLKKRLEKAIILAS